MNHLYSVLVVDDDPDFLDLLSRQLKQIPDISLTVAHGPREAVQLLTRNRYKLVVSDWALLSVTAQEVLNEADDILESGHRGTSPSKVPVMFMSGSEKVGQTQRMGLKHFEPVSFILKRCGPPMISSLAEHMLRKFGQPRTVQPRATSLSSVS
jgi:CheY-like chemotaxis protein